MYYILNPNIALRSWQGLPFAYYIKGSAEPHGLSEEQFFTLIKCDGDTDIDPSELYEGAPVSPCIKGEAKLTPWQEHMICNNRCFPMINLMLTGRCNYNCIHCFNAIDNAPLQSEFSFDEAKDLIEQARQCGVTAFMLTGGEPMVHRNFYDIVSLIYQKGMYVSRINTNASLIDAKALDSLDKIGCRPLMKISFDGIGYHDMMRGVRGAEERTLTAIKLCIERGFRVMVQTNVNSLNLSSMLPTAELLDSYGVSTMRVIRTSESPRWDINCYGKTLSFEDYYSSMLELTAAYKGKMKLDVWQMLELEGNSLSITAVKTCSPNDVICQGNRRMAAIASSGELYPCNQLSGLFESDGISLGNVKKTPLRELFSKGAYLDAVCMTVKDITDLDNECRECRYLPLCNGGCRVLAYCSSGSYTGKDLSKCIFFKEGWYDKTKKLQKEIMNHG